MKPTLTPDERFAGLCMNLAMEAAKQLVGRLQKLLRQSDPGDAALQNLLDGLTREHQADLGLLDGCRSLDGIPSAEPSGVTTALSKAFPSFPGRFGEGWLDRDVALYFAESLEEEASRFYRTLAECMSDTNARLTLDEQSWRAGGRLAKLRTVLL